MSTLTDMVDSYLTPKLKEGETVDLSQFTPRQRTNIRLYGLDFKDYTAKEINEYKLNWIENNKDCVNIIINDGKRSWVKKFCRKHFYHQDFHIEIGKDLRELNTKMDDIIFFKNPQDAMVFKLAYKG